MAEEATAVRNFAKVDIRSVAIACILSAVGGAYFSAQGATATFAPTPAAAVTAMPSTTTTTAVTRPGE